MSYQIYPTAKECAILIIGFAIIFSLIGAGCQYGCQKINEKYKIEIHTRPVD